MAKNLKQIIRPRLTIGYRAGDMILISIVWLIVGYGLIKYGDPEPEIDTPIEVLPFFFREAVWIAPALFSIAMALVPKFRERDWDKWAFAGLIFPPALRALSYGWVEIVSWTPFREDGVEIFPKAVVWVIITWLVMRLARRPEMPHRPGGGDFGHHPGGMHGHPGLGEAE